MIDKTATDAILLQLSQDFLESCEDSLDVVDTAITRLIDGDGEGDGGGVWDDDFAELLRQVHSVKGSGGTFGFPAITLIAHSLEDYIETAAEIGRRQLGAIQVFIDAIRAILGRGKNPSDTETIEILRGLPVSRQARTIGGGQTPRDIGFLLVMPKGLQRRIIGGEMASCGFRVTLSENAVQAIELALANPPDIIAANMFLDDMTGVELARVFKGIDATAKANFMLMTSSDTGDPKTMGLPLGSRIVRKGNQFSEDLSMHLMDWGVFGDIKAKPKFTDIAETMKADIP